MASWLDDLRPASFRGVSFKIDSHQFTGGRRVTFHEFPDRNTPYAEDIGRVGNTFRVEGYLLGDNIAEQKRKMIAAVEALGPGELVHPYLGTKQVQCGPFSIEESRGQGRITKITFQFYEAGDNRYPNNVDDKQTVLLAKADSALAKSRDAFAKKFSVTSLPGFAVDSARSAVNQAATAFETATKGLARQADQISALAFNIRNLRAEVNDLIKAPGQLAQRLQDSFKLLQNALNGNKDAYKATVALQGFTSLIEASPFDTPTRAREKSNNDAFTNFMRQTALIESASLASEVTFDSTEDALAARESVVEATEEQLLITDDDDVFAALSDLQAQLVRVVPDFDAELPNIQNVTLQNSIPAFVLSYDLFQHLESEQDIIDRNKISHPGFVPGGALLEVLNVRAGA